MLDVRYCDLLPDIPLADDGSVLEVYADDIATFELLGRNFRTTFFTWGFASGSAILRRVPVIRVTRPCESHFCTNAVKLLRCAGRPHDPDCRTRH